MADFDSAQSPLEETFQLQFPRSLVLGLTSGATLAAMVVGGLIFPVFLLITLGGVLSGMVPVRRGMDLVSLLLGTGMFLGVALAFFGALSLPICLIGNIFKGKRVIRVESGVLNATIGSYRVSQQLVACRWRKRSTTIEGFTVLSLRRPSVQIMISERQFVICGFDEQKLRMWTGFLRLAGVPELPGIQRPRNVRPALLRVCAGLSIGLGFGALAHAATGNPHWTLAGLVTGTLDGIFSGLAWLSASHATNTSSFGKSFMVSCVFGLSLLGMKVGFAAGWPGGIVYLLVNGIAGWCIARDAQRRFQQLTTKPEVIENCDDAHGQ